MKLESKDFAVVGKETRQHGWLEFDVECNGVRYENVGGQKYDVFANELLGVLSKERGVKVSSIKNAPYIDRVGSQAEYLGYVVLSSYTTFSFFKVGTQRYHVVMADNAGTLVAHTPLTSDIVSAWREQLSESRP